MSSSVEDAADLSLRLDRIRKQTDQLLTSEADSVATRALAERISRELDAARVALKRRGNPFLVSVEIILSQTHAVRTQPVPKRFHPYHVRLATVSPLTKPRCGTQPLHFEQIPVVAVKQIPRRRLTPPTKPRPKPRALKRPGR